jgi:ferredoxin--NADP+ reductase
MEGVPYDERGGKFLNDNGKIADRLYCVGWARRGPTGTIGTNRPDGYEVAAQIEAAMPPESSGNRSGAAGLKALLAGRDVMPTDYDDWHRIEQTEAANARPGSPREKFVRVEDWLKAVGR